MHGWATPGMSRVLADLPREWGVVLDLFPSAEPGIASIGSFETLNRPTPLLDR
jgi:hypothetical protein